MGGRAKPNGSDGANEWAYKERLAIKLSVFPLHPRPPPKMTDNNTTTLTNDQASATMPKFSDRTVDDTIRAPPTIDRLVQIELNWEQDPTADRNLWSKETAAAATQTLCKIEEAFYKKSTAGSTIILMVPTPRTPTLRFEANYKQVGKNPSNVWNYTLST
jgi:hypothetical protein